MPFLYDYRLLIEKLTESAAFKRQPINGTFELTDRCNLSCKMCYICQKMNDYTYRHSELSAKQWLEIAKQGVDNGLMFLLLTGGEVFVRPDFFDLFTPLTRLGLIITVYSNGTMISDAIASKFAEAPPSRIEISLYGATPSTYEAITQIPGSFARCIAGIEALIKYHIPISLKTTLIKQNIHEFNDMKRLADLYGVPLSASWMLINRHDEKQIDMDLYRLPAKEAIELEIKDEASAYELQEQLVKPINPVVHEKFFCQCGKTAFAINSKGEMNACLDLPYPSAKVIDVGFKKAWEMVKQFVDNAQEISGACASCEFFSFCPRCPAMSYLEDGELDSQIPYCCSIAKYRKELVN